MARTAVAVADPVTQYARDVVDSNIVTGKWVRLACERHLQDLERQGKDAFPYVFDPARAERVFSFFGFCRHVKGPLAGEPIEPAPFTTFVVGSVFGWVHRDTGLRRFRKAYVQVARGNAKSTTLSVLGLYMLMADGELGAEVYATATMREQARIVYNAARTMAIRSPDLLKRLEPGRSKIEHPTTESVFKPLSKDTEKLDGLAPHLGIIDEYHAHPDASMYEVLASALNKRAQPLLMVITTAGFDLSSPCYQEYLYCQKLLENTLENENYFTYIAQLDDDDDRKDPANWVKANPLVATTDWGLRDLKAEFQEAIDDPRKMRNFRTKNLDDWVDQKADGYMPMEKWRACGIAARGEPMPDLTGRECILGVDLSAKIDLCSVTFAFPLDDGLYAVISHSFMPTDTLAAKRRDDKVPYDLWVEQGWITATDGAVVDYDHIEQHIEDCIAERGWKIKEICVDPWNATQFATNMANKGFTVVEIRQGIKTLGDPTKDFKEKALSGKIVHDDNPVLTWAMSNAVTRQDANGNIMLDKSKARERIDPAAATITAHVRAIHHDPKPQQQQRAGISRL